MVPSIGRTVHTTLPEGHPNKGGHRAAVITAVYADSAGVVVDGASVDVTVFLQPGEKVGTAHAGSHGFLFLEKVPCDVTGKTPGTWHEPERVKETSRVERAA